MLRFNDERFVSLVRSCAGIFQVTRHSERHRVIDPLQGPLKTSDHVDPSAVHGPSKWEHSILILKKVAPLQTEILSNYPGRNPIQNPVGLLHRNRILFRILLGSWIEQDIGRKRPGQ